MPQSSSHCAIDVSSPQATRLRKAIAPYLCLETLRDLATHGGAIQAALRSTDSVPDEVQAILSLLAALLAPIPGKAIGSAVDVVALLMVEIGCLDYEEFWVMCLNTEHYIQRIMRLYHGTLNTSMVRVSEVFRLAVSLNSEAIIVAHNHPGGCVTPSPEDLEITQQLRKAGQLLDIELLDHFIIAQGRWQSLRMLRPAMWEIDQ
jgi:DNA repair protein RadC